MIAEVGQALTALLRDELGGNVQLSLDAPLDDRTTPQVDVYLFDLAEDVTRRQHGAVRVHDDGGRVVAVRPPLRYFVLSYALTAWAHDPHDAHRILDMVLRVALRHQVLPAQALPEMVAPVTVALREAPAGLWAGLGIPLRPAVCVAVTVPVAPDMARPVGPPVEGALRVSLTGAAHLPVRTEA